MVDAIVTNIKENEFVINGWNVSFWVDVWLCNIRGYITTTYWSATTNKHGKPIHTKEFETLEELVNEIQSEDSKYD